MTGDQGVTRDDNGEVALEVGDDVLGFSWPRRLWDSLPLQGERVL